MWLRAYRRKARRVRRMRPSESSPSPHQFRPIPPRPDSHEPAKPGTPVHARMLTDSHTRTHHNHILFISRFPYLPTLSDELPLDRHSSTHTATPLPSPSHARLLACNCRVIRAMQSPAVINIISRQSPEPPPPTTNVLLRVVRGRARHEKNARLKHPRPCLMCAPPSGGFTSIRRTQARAHILDPSGPVAAESLV